MQENKTKNYNVKVRYEVIGQEKRYYMISAKSKESVREIIESDEFNENVRDDPNFYCRGYSGVKRKPCALEINEYPLSAKVLISKRVMKEENIVFEDKIRNKEYRENYED